MKIFILVFMTALMACAHSAKNSEHKVAPTKSGYVSVNGIEMYYETYGSGQPLVLMHGGGSSIQVSFGRGISELAKHYQVIAFDEQNHGRTKAYDRELTFTNTADDIAEALKKMQIEKAYFLGFSNGATTGMQLAIRHPEIVQKMVLGSGLYQRSGAPKEFWAAMNGATIDHMPQELKDAYVKTAPEPKDLQKMFAGDSKRMQKFTDISEKEIRKVQIPVLIMQNDQDVATLEHAVKTVRLLPKGRLAILPGPHDNYIGDVSVDNKALKQASLNIILEFFKAL